jgi:hypothetical protein
MLYHFIKLYFYLFLQRAKFLNLDIKIKKVVRVALELSSLTLFFSMYVSPHYMLF